MVDKYQARHRMMKGVESGSWVLGGLGGCTTHPPSLSPVRKLRVSSHSDLYGFAFGTGKKFNR
eukprot:1931794-Prorocentrum_lima.AAC.1